MSTHQTHRINQTQNANLDRSNQTHIILIILYKIQKSHPPSQQKQPNRVRLQENKDIP